MSYKYIVWDWNGTLLDDVQIGVDCMNIMLEHHNYPQRIDINKYREVFCFPVIDYYVNVGLDFSKQSFNELADLFIENNDRLIKNATLYSNVKETLDCLKNDGFTQLVISATEQGRLDEQISSHNIFEYFDYILGKNDYLARSKLDIARDWLLNNDINEEDVLFIGDTLHDFEVASELGCDCVLIPNGHQSRSRLTECGADLVDNVKQIIKYCHNH